MPPTRIQRVSLQRMCKRAVDVAASAAGLCVLAPVLGATALAVRLDSPGPILFRQTRVGRDFRPFCILKFRTMVTDADRLGPQVTSGADPRITRVGRVLRRTKLDEIPQLWNVLRGDMSLVGPRPEVPRYVEQFRDQFAEVLTTRPGITDPASLVYRDESAVLATYPDPERAYVEHVLPEKLSLARDYVQRMSLAGDLRLLVRTLAALRH